MTHYIEVNTSIKALPKGYFTTCRLGLKWWYKLHRGDQVRIIEIGNNPNWYLPVVVESLDIFQFDKLPKCAIYSNYIRPLSLGALAEDMYRAYGEQFKLESYVTIIGFRI